MSIIGQRYNLVIHGTPIGGHSWKEICNNWPIIIIISVIFALYTNYFMNELRNKKIADENIAKKRLDEREKYYSEPNTYECRVCGCYSEDFPWGEDGRSPTYHICPCCGVQFGKEDISLESIKKYRDEWITKGGIWFVKNKKPDGWNMEIQMKNIPEKFK